MSTITASASSVKAQPRARREVITPVGTVEFASPHYDPRRSLGAFGRDPVRFFALDRERTDLVRPAAVKTTGDLQDFLDINLLDLTNQVLLGRASDVFPRGWGGWYRMTIVMRSYEIVR